MNFKLLAKLLGILTILIGFFMLLSLIWANPDVGFHTHGRRIADRFETRGFWGLVYSTLICWGFGGLLYWQGRGSDTKIYRKEAMAVVGLSWVLATVFGALPYVFSGTGRGPAVRVQSDSQRVLVSSSRFQFWNAWNEVEDLTEAERSVLNAVANASARGVNGNQLIRLTGVEDAPRLFMELAERPGWDRWLVAPGKDPSAPADRASHYRVRWLTMSFVDAMFEAQSGFSTTGATVICDLEDPHLVPHCILFWRSSTHFLGGLGIIVLFVVLLGQGSAGKALMRAEMPGPTQENATARMQQNAWLFAATYIGLNIVLAIILAALGMSALDAICHSFGTMATGGFSTYNASLGHFLSVDSDQGRIVEYVVIVFMILAGTNFTLLFLVLTGKPQQLLRDLEFKTYLGIAIVFSTFIIIFGLVSGLSDFDTFEKAFRNSTFQVTSILTTTGFGTADFDQWSQFNRLLMLLLMFIGGCAGSTGGGMKVIRHVLFAKILRMEIDHSFHPKEVRLLKLAGKPVDDQKLRHSILVYFGLIIVLFVFGLVFVVMIEPDLTWGGDPQNKLIDSASAVAATLNNIGPGLGVVGATQNYSNFCDINKVLFIWFMMLGRLEILPILVLFAPRFWRDQ
jgi:trk system potassium uptake protein TrkH